VAVPVVDVITNERESFICNHVNKRYCQAGITDQKNSRRYHYEKKVRDIKSSGDTILTILLDNSTLAFFFHGQHHLEANARKKRE
jgi:hypothetical protein